MNLKTLALFAGLMLIAVRPVTARADLPSAPLTITSEAEQIARGFAAAFNDLQRTPVYLTYERAGKLWTISSVTSVRAVGGVLVIVTDKRLTYVINARDVIGMSDAPPEK